MPQTKVHTLMETRGRRVTVWPAAVRRARSTAKHSSAPSTAPTPTKCLESAVLYVKVSVYYAVLYVNVSVYNVVLYVKVSVYYGVLYVKVSVYYGLLYVKVSVYYGVLYVKVSVYSGVLYVKVSVCGAALCQSKYVYPVLCLCETKCMYCPGGQNKSVYSDVLCVKVSVYCAAMYIKVSVHNGALFIKISVCICT